MKKIALVVGHSEKKQGAVNQTFEVTEFGFNSSLIHIVHSCLAAYGYDVVDIYRENGYKKLPSEINRTDADVCISLHCNAFNKRVSGSEVLYWFGSDKASKLASAIQREVILCLGLKNTIMPCVIVEPFFIDNDLDFKTGLDLIEQLGASIAAGIHEYFKEG